MHWGLTVNQILIVLRVSSQKQNSTSLDEDHESRACCIQGQFMTKFSLKCIFGHYFKVIL
jgi:hypothetical protein